MKLKIIFCLVSLFMWAFVSEAQLIVTVSAVKAEGNKALVKLDFRNNLTNAVESARASLYLLNSESVVGQATHWVIGGTKDKPSLVPGATNSFFFVVSSDKPFPRTNLIAKVNFTRVVMQDGALADVEKDVKIEK
jgi:hypothetical protein